MPRRACQRTSCASAAATTAAHGATRCMPLTPRSVRATAERLTDDAIVGRLARSAERPEWVTLSGGNPALHQLAAARHSLARARVPRSRPRRRDPCGATGSRRSIGSRSLPSRRSSAWPTSVSDRRFRRLHGRREFRPRDVSILKIVCFDDIDLEWATQVARELPDAAAVPVGRHADPDARRTFATPLASGTAGCASAWLRTQTSRHARVLPQLHVIAWKEATRRMNPVELNDLGRRARRRARGRVTRARTEIFKEFTFEAAHRLPYVPAGPQVLPAPRPQLPRRDPRRGRGRRDDGLDHGLRRHQGRPSSRSTRARPQLPQRGPGTREPDQREPRPWIWDRLRPRLPGLARILVRETCTSGLRRTRANRRRSEPARGHPNCRTFRTSPTIAACRSTRSGSRASGCRSASPDRGGTAQPTVASDRDERGTRRRHARGRT